MMRHLLIIGLFFSTTAYAQVHLRVGSRHAGFPIENFGASDAWSCQYVGKWPEEARAQMADWLFSLDTLPDGSPKGIGLSMWRVNLGAGSAEQGDVSGIKDPWRRAGEISGQDGQLWFLSAARQRHVPQFLGFLNSPPVSLTRNGKAFAVGGKSNIDAARFPALADYIVDEIGRVKKATGVNFDYISPVNEPQWDWSDGGQEGNPYLNSEIYGVVKALDGALGRSRLPTKILVTESGHIKYLLPAGDKPGRDNQIAFFFDPASPNYIGNLSHVGKVVAAHSYFSTSSWEKGIALRRSVAERLAAFGKTRFWQSEYCILGDNEGVIDGRGKDTAMEGALYMARVIHNDLVDGAATAWQWWLAISPYDYKDGLIYVDKRGTGGKYSDSRRLWALGNYSRFVRPGMVRVDAGFEKDSDSTGLSVSVFEDGRSRRRVIVVINENKEARQLVLGVPKEVISYTTTMGENLKKRIFRDGTVDISAHSVTSLVTRF